MVALVAAVAGVLAPAIVRWLLRRPVDPEPLGRAVREALQRLGVTYVKLGQFMAMRFDILPPEVCRELSRLFDDVAPCPPEQIEQLLREEFGRPSAVLFRQFEAAPVAAASVAQVHRGITWAGDEVAIKLQRPGIAAIFAADMRNIRRVAAFVDRVWPMLPQPLATAVDEFERFTRREMDFREEGRTAERLRRNAGAFERVPRIFWKQTTARVLTMEFVHGHRLSDVMADLERQAAGEQSRLPAGLDVDRGMRNLAHASLRQLFVKGFFHADPHPGNIFLREDGSVTFVDFGIFCDMPEQRRATLAAYIENVAVGNFAAGYQHFVQLLIPTERTDQRRLKRDVQAIFRLWHDASHDVSTPLADRHAGRFFGAFINAMRENQVQMSLDTLLFWRALITLDATALRFRHSFDLLGVMRDFFESNSPTPARRVLDVATDLRLHADCRRLAANAPRFATAAVGRAGRVGGLRYRHVESGSRRGAAHAAAAPALSLLGASIALAISRLPVGATWKSAAILGLLALIGVSVGRRWRTAP